MKKLVIFLSLLILATSAYSQEKPVIRWDASNSDGCCSNYMRNNRLNTSFTNADIEYLVVMHTELLDDYFVFSVGVLNKSGKPLTIEPTKFSMRMTAPVNQTYQPIAPDVLAKKVKTKGSWRELLAAGFAGMATRRSTATITDNNGRQSNVQITERDTEAIDRANRDIQQNRAAKANKADAVMEFALPAHTLFKDEMKTGFVYFKKGKIGDGMILSFELGNVVYEIPYGAERKK